MGARNNNLVWNTTTEEWVPEKDTSITLSNGREAGLAVVEFASETAILNDQNYYTSWIEKATPTNKAQIQFRNPTVDKNYILSGIFIPTLDAADSYRIQYNYGSNLGSGTANPLNTYIGGAASLAEIRSADTATIYGTWAYNMLPLGAVGQIFNLLDTTGMVLAPGNDIIIVNNTATKSLSVGFAWKEVNL